jgi:hypothetical protein
LGEGTRGSTEASAVALAEILADEQKAKLKELLGPRFEGEASTGFNPAAGRAGGFGNAQPFKVGEVSQSASGWLQYAPVREELKLTPEQSQQIAPLAGRPETTNADVAKVLTAEQIARLRQIQLQQSLRNRTAAYLFRYREVAEALAWSAEQRQKIETIAQANTRLGMPQAEIDAVRAQVDEVLTPQQRTKFDELMGKPFALDLRTLLRDSARGDRSR